MGTIQESIYNGAMETNTNKINGKESSVQDSEQEIVNNPVQKPTSMTSLILWNITKALEKNPSLDLKNGIRAAQSRLRRDARLANTAISAHPEEQHLICAVLAWQQLGHDDTDSLYHFIETNNADLCVSKVNDLKVNNNREAYIVTSNSINICCNKNTNLLKGVDSLSFASYSSGPVVKLPVEPKIIMRMDNTSSRPIGKSRCCATTNKIDAACCKDSACVAQLAAMDASTKELRSRATKLAKREAERVALLERAEAAWRDLELGYQRRLTLAEEKEEDIARQIQKAIKDRANYKNACAALTDQLKEKGEEVEAERVKLKALEREVCDRACTRAKLSDEAAKYESTLAGEQCKLMQLERDLQFKEEQARHKLQALDGETASARALTHETERALRAELSGLREQIVVVSNELLDEDEENGRIKEELDELRQVKMDMINELEGCKSMCESKMQKQLDELQQKINQIEKLKENVLECKCKMPVDVMVEAKRTPSLAALCKCAPEDRLMATCSCTSLRGSLISTLLADLFGGLQSELGGAGSQMPCKLLKCLEDKHNWDRASAVKTHLRNFFSKLLVGELDIAIATSIENYHAKWVGASCVDESRMTPGPGDDQNAGWEQRALERRAQKLAAQLAEQLFEQRAEELTKRAKEIVTSGPPPCECNATRSQTARVLPCLLEASSPFGGANSKGDQQQSGETPAFWKRTHHDVTLLRKQIEDLKKESIKKEDLKIMEQKIAKIVKQTTDPEIEDIVTKDVQSIQIENNRKETKSIKSINMDNKLGSTKKKPFDGNSLKKTTIEKAIKQSKKYNHHQTYAVNLCLCGPQKPNKTLLNTQISTEGKSDIQRQSKSFKQKSSKEGVSQASSVKHTKPINTSLPFPVTDEINSKLSIEPFCGSDCNCFHKVPSNTSIDKLLDTLTKWKCDLSPQNKSSDNMKSPKSFPTKNSKSILKNKVPHDSKACSLASNNKEQSNKSAISEAHENLIGAEKFNRSINFNQAVNTASEYMAAVNLDKSNDNYSKYADVEDSNGENKQQKYNERILSGCSVKLADSTPESNKKSQIHKQIQKSESKDINKVKVLNEHLYGKISRGRELNVLTNSKSTRIVNHKLDEQKPENIEIVNETNLSPNRVNQNKLTTNNLDYCIKFLGVTLADLSSQKVVNKSTKDNYNKTVNYIPTSLCRKEQHFDNETRAHIMRSSPPVSASKGPKDDYSMNLPCIRKQCECNAKFDEFKSFMINILNDQSKNTHVQQKDIALDSQSLKFAENTLDTCVCCNSFDNGSSRELEVNTFHLLEDHLKEKLKQFTCSCKSSCIPPEQEEKIFSTIIKRVKQVISDCANEIQCTTSSGLQTEGSWKRAYGLLQEYLKIKLQRVQCLPFLKDTNEFILPDILEKVCNLIENDFQRLKNICKCKKNDESLKKSSLMEYLLLPNEDLPEKDTNIFDKKYDTSMANDCLKLVSKQNSVIPIIITENMSSQVPPNLGMETKCCDIMDINNKNDEATETNPFFTSKRSQEVIYNPCDCYQNQDQPKEDVLKLFGTKEVLVNFYTDILLNSNDIGVSKSMNQKSKLTCQSVIDKENAKSLPDFQIMERCVKNTKLNEFNKQNSDNYKSSFNHPYIGCTIDCVCDSSLKTCICTKSAVDNNNDEINYIWKQFAFSKKKNNPDVSYIMNSIRNENNLDNIGIKDNDLSKNNLEFLQHNNIEMCEAATNVKNGEDMILLLSNEHLDTIHQTTNTFEENPSLVIDVDSDNTLDWFECPQFVKSEIRSSTVKINDSPFFSESIDDSKSFKSETSTGTESTKSSQKCNCDRVPLCHVKMLVENIEKNLIESKCTCDSVSKVCPVHLLTNQKCVLK